MQTNPDAKYLILINDQQRQILINALGGVVNDEDENEADLLLAMFKGDGGLQADSEDKDVVNDFTA